MSLTFIVPTGKLTSQEYRDDPIFPAIEYGAPPGLKLGYHYTTTRAGVLGCVDSFQICNSDETRCWDQSNLTQALDSFKACDDDSLEFDPRCSELSVLPSPLRQRQILERQILYLLDVALRDTDSAGSLQRQGVSVLDATTRMSVDQVYQYLAPEQWKVEAENFFQISLARMQVNLFDFVRETYAALPGYERVPAYAANAYRLYKFPAVGYKDISGYWFIGTLLFCAGLFLWSRRYSTPEQREASIRRNGHGGFHDNLWGTIVVRILWSGIYQTFLTLVASFHWIWTMVTALWQAAGAWLHDQLNNIRIGQV